uniref:tellurite resistance TerB family protein n=1 Tax=Actinosynnema sp. TaxID=1872144 RepID=UPI003F8661F9
ALEVSDAEWGHLVAYLQSRLDLTPGERMRLTAHLDWLLVSPLKLTGLAKRISVLGDEQRAQIAEVASAIAAADGEISESEVAVLRKIYKLLGQDPDSVRTGIVAFREAETKPVSVLQGGTDGGGGGEVAAMLAFEEEQENG